MLDKFLPMSNNDVVYGRN